MKGKHISPNYICSFPLTFYIVDTYQIYIICFYKRFNIGSLIMVPQTLLDRIQKLQLI